MITKAFILAFKVVAGVAGAAAVGLSGLGSVIGGGDDIDKALNSQQTMSDITEFIQSLW